MAGPTWKCAQSILRGTAPAAPSATQSATRCSVRVPSAAHPELPPAGGTRADAQPSKSGGAASIRTASSSEPIAAAAPAEPAPAAPVAGGGCAAPARRRSRHRHRPPGPAAPAGDGRVDGCPGRAGTPLGARRPTSRTCPPTSRREDGQPAPAASQSPDASFERRNKPWPPPESAAPAKRGGFVPTRTARLGIGGPGRSTAQPTPPGISAPVEHETELALR